MKSIGVLAAAFLLGSVGLASAQTLTNPDFAGETTNAQGITGFSGWSVTGVYSGINLDVYGNNLVSGNPGYVSPGGSVPFTTFADFNNATAITVSQKATGLVSGQLYDITFWLATGGSAQGGTNTFSASFGATNDVLSGINSQLYFTEYSFEALDTNGIIKFTVNAPAGTDIALSDVNIVLVPEPVSLVVLGTGLAGLGLVRRRRRGA